eukprot:7494830-Pyramimonas_sp.AAC.1
MNPLKHACLFFGAAGGGAGGRGSQPYGRCGAVDARAAALPGRGQRGGGPAGGGALPPGARAESGAAGA